MPTGSQVMSISGLGKMSTAPNGICVLIEEAA
jgi:hypothetical protein